MSSVYGSDLNASSKRPDRQLLAEAPPPGVGDKSWGVRRQLPSLGCAWQGASGRNTPARSSLSTHVQTWSRRSAGHRGGPALPRRTLTTGVHLTHRAPPPTVCPALPVRTSPRPRGNRPRRVKSFSIRAQPHRFVVGWPPTRRSSSGSTSTGRTAWQNWIAASPRHLGSPPRGWLTEWAVRPCATGSRVPRTTGRGTSPLPTSFDDLAAAVAILGSSNLSRNRVLPHAVPGVACRRHRRRRQDRSGGRAGVGAGHRQRGKCGAGDTFLTSIAG
jgi:hypothetical protein